MSETEEYTSRFLLNYERSKEKLLKRMQTIEDALFTAARRLKQEMDVSPELTYELRLPQSHGEKGYFIRKDNDQ